MATGEYAKTLRAMAPMTRAANAAASPASIQPITLTMLVAVSVLMDPPSSLS
jgi:hypothetical protein